MPEPRQGAAAAAVGDKIYVVGGGNGNGGELATMVSPHFPVARASRPSRRSAPRHTLRDDHFAQPATSMQAAAECARACPGGGAGVLRCHDLRVV